MPRTDKEKRKEYNRLYYQKRKAVQNQSKTPTPIKEASDKKSNNLNSIKHYFEIEERKITDDSPEKQISKEESTQTDHTIEINKYIDSIKRFLKVGERYVIEIPSASLNIPVFFYRKQINEENIIVDYVKIDFLKLGTGESTISPTWDEMKDERIIYNKDIVNIYPYDEKKKYRYDLYCYIRNDVREFYGIVNKR